MQNVRKSDAAGNGPESVEAEFVGVGLSALQALDARLTAAAHLAIAAREGRDSIGLEYAVSVLDDLGDATASIAHALFAGVTSDTPASADEVAFGMARTAARYHAKVCLLSGAPTSRPIGPEHLPTVDDEAVVHQARDLAARFAPWRRRIVASAAAPPEYGADRAAQQAWFDHVGVSIRPQWSPELSAIAVLLNVAPVALWGPKVPVGTSLVIHALPAVLAAMRPRDDGAAIVRHALVALGHRPDDYAAASRAARNRDARAADLAGWREKAPDRFRRTIRHAVANAGGVNNAAAKKLGITVDTLRKLVASDPALESELDAANTDAPPKSG